MEPVVFDNATVIRHSLYGKCGATLNEVSERDYPGKDYFDPAIGCLDMDTYETAICHGRPDCTVDAVIGIADCVNKCMSNQRLLLVELRLGYINADNLSKTKLESKVLHSKALLGAEMPVNRQSIFVFSDSVAPKAQHIVEAYKHEGGEIKHAVVFSLSDFSYNILSYDSLPYEPINPPDVLVSTMQSLIDSSCDKELFKQVRHWLGEIERYRYRNVFECQNIRDIVGCVWKYYKEHKTDFVDDDEELSFLLLDEDVYLALY